MSTFTPQKGLQNPDTRYRTRLDKHQEEKGNFFIVYIRILKYEFSNVQCLSCRDPKIRFNLMIGVSPHIIVTSIFLRLMFAATYTVLRHWVVMPHQNHS